MKINEKIVNKNIKINSFFEIFIKFETHNLINWINSFTFILFINKNDLKNVIILNVNLSIMK